MSRRPSDILRRDCESSQTCDNACNYIVFGTEISGLSFANRLDRNGISKPITALTQGGNRTDNEGILSPNYIVSNVKNALQNLQPLTVQFVNASDASDFEELSEITGPLDLTDTRTITYYVPTGVIGGTLGQYMFQRVGRWEYPVSGQSSLRVLQYIRQYATPVCFNRAEARWASRLSDVMGIPLVNSPVGRGPGILDHNEVFLKEIGSMCDSFDGRNSSDLYSVDTGDGIASRLVREIGLELYHRVQAKGIDVRSSVRNIMFERGSSSGLFNVTIDNRSTYPDSKIAFKINPFLKLRIAAIGGLGIISEMIPSEYRLVIPFPVNSAGLRNSEFVSRLMYTYGGNSWMNSYNWSDDSSCGGCSDYSRKSSCGCRRSDVSSRCSCGSTGNTGSTGCTGIDFTNITPGADLVYAYLGFSSGNPFACNRSVNSNSTQATWNIQAYVTSDDLYTTSQSGNFSQNGSLFLVVDGQNTANRRLITFDPEGDQLNVRFNNDSVECNSALQFAHICSDIIYALTCLRIPPKALLKVRTTCTANGDCDAESLITNTPNRQSTLSFLVEVMTQLYGSSSSATIL